MVQILLSTYNGEKYLAEQLDSILNQTYKDISILVRDDGSTDATLNILEKYKSTGRLNYYAEENLGVVGSFFNLIHNANKVCDYFAFCDQDDYWQPWKIEKAVKMLENKKLSNDIPIAYGSQIQVVDENLVRLNSGKKVKRLSFGNALLENVITGCTSLFNRSMLEYLDKVTDTEGIFMHDWFLYMISVSIGEVIYDEDESVLYRQHSENVLGASRGILHTAKRKMLLFKKYLSTSLIRKNIDAFYNIYNTYLKPEQKEIILRYKRGCLADRLWLLTSSEFSRQRGLDNCWFKIMIFLGLM